MPLCLPFPSLPSSDYIKDDLEVCKGLTRDKHFKRSMVMVMFSIMLILAKSAPRNPGARSEKHDTNFVLDRSALGHTPFDITEAVPRRPSK